MELIHTKIDRLEILYNHIKDQCNKRNKYFFGGWEYFEDFKEWAFFNNYDENSYIRLKNSRGNYIPKNCKWEKIAKIKSKYKFIYWSDNNKKWVAYLYQNKKTQTIGYFKEIKEAFYCRNQYIIDKKIEKHYNLLKEKAPI